MATFTVPYTDTAGNPRTSATVTLEDGTDPALPLVILLHGFTGTEYDMTDPARSPGITFDTSAAVPPLRDHGWHGAPAAGIRNVRLDPTTAVTSWKAALAAEGFGTVSYGQAESTGALDTPVREFAAVMAEVLQRVPATRRLAVVAHSRGGLLIRRWLADVAADTALTSRFALLATVSTPHRGTGLPILTSALNGALNALIAANPALAPALLRLQAIVTSAGFQEMALGSSFLTALAAAEAAGGAPLVPTHTVGGTSTLISRARAWVYTPASAVPVVTSLVPLRVQFHWTTFPVPLPALVAGIPALGLLSPELRDTEGDVVVTPASSRLAGELSHAEFPVNHFQSLWDPATQQHVIALLRAA